VSDQHQPAPGEPDFDAVPDFDDRAFDDLRGLLAASRVTDPVPDEVAARLEATLASLRDQHPAGAEPTGGTVVLLRRRVGRVLVAAAAVAAVATGTVAVVQGARDDTSGADSAASAGGQADADKAAPEASSQDGVRAPTDQGAAAVAELSSAHFARDAASAMRALSIEQLAGDAPVPAATPAAPSPVTTPDDTTEDTTGTAGTKTYELQRLKAPPVTATPEAVTGALSSRASTGCAGPAAPDSVTLPATLDGVPVALVFRPPTSSEQRVEAWSCDGSSLLASATVPR
jgi:hypothetical protein